MTPQQKVIGDLLQVSLFKLAEQQHQTIRRLRLEQPHMSNRLDAMAVEIEKAIDATFVDFRDHAENFSITDIENINQKIVDLKNALNG